jgi:hypothetical protein
LTTSASCVAVNRPTDSDCGGRDTRPDADRELGTVGDAGGGVRPGEDAVAVEKVAAAIAANINIKNRETKATN